jgi:hypothetical protein
VFPRDNAGHASAQSASIALATDSAVTLYWSGLAPNTGYDVDASAGQVRLSPGTEHETDDAGLLQLDIHP